MNTENKSLENENKPSCLGAVISSVGLKVYGELKIWKCPICDYDTQKFGDLENPISLIVGEMICLDCRGKIRQIIGK